MARNMYGGNCYCCGTYIKPGFGHFLKHYGGITKWRIKCASGRLVKEHYYEVQNVLKKLDNINK